MSNGTRNAAGTQPAKVCALCGADVAGKARVKDGSGNYYCRACYDAKLAERSGGASGNAGGDAAPEESEHVVFADQPLPTPGPVTPTRRRAADSGGGSPLDWLIRPQDAARRLAAGEGAMSFLARSFAPTFLMAAMLCLPDTLGSCARVFPLIGDSWAIVGSVSTLFAIIVGVLYWRIGPFVYGLRVKMAGGDVPDGPSVRAVYFLSAIPAFLVALVGALMIPLGFARPSDFIEAAPSLHFVVLPVITCACLALGCITTGLVAWKGWKANGAATVILIVLIPWIIYAFSAAWITATAGLMSLRAENDDLVPAPVTHTTNAETRSSGSSAHHQSAADLPLAFDYPASWTVESGPSSSASGQRAVRVVAPDESWIHVSLVTGQASDDVVRQQFARELLGAGYRLVPIGDMRSLGPFEGEGKQFALTGQSAAKSGASAPIGGQVQVFVGRAESGERILIATFLLDRQRAEGQRGINLVVSSLKVGSPR